MMDERSNIIKIKQQDQLVPENHLVRHLDKAIDLNFIYDLVEDLYSPLSSENGSCCFN